MEREVVSIETEFIKLDSLLKSYINIIDISGGVLTLDVTVPGFATELYAKVLDTEKLSEDLKLKLLGMTTMTGEDAVALVDALTLGEIIEVLEAVNPKALHCFPEHWLCRSCFG